jgi:adenylate kinase
MNIILFGAPGAGKGTQANLIKDSFGYSHFATGDKLREEALVDPKLDTLLKSGQLVSWNVIEPIFLKFLKKSGNNVLLDGIPRTLEQVEKIDSLFATLGKKVDKVFYLNMSDDLILNRILNRWICVYNGHKTPMTGKKEDLEKVCLGTLERRSDDNESTVKNRIKAYKDETFPVLNIYKKRDIVVEIEASLSPEDVFSQIKRHL